MELDALAGLLAGPVHEEPVLEVHEPDGAEHDGNHTRRGDPPERAHDEPEPAEELGRDDEQSEYGRDAQSLIEEPDRLRGSASANGASGFSKPAASRASIAAPPIPPAATSAPAARRSVSSSICRRATTESPSRLVMREAIL
jgi:hypothetical protein